MIFSLQVILHVPYWTRILVFFLSFMYSAYKWFTCMKKTLLFESIQKTFLTQIINKKIFGVFTMFCFNLIEILALHSRISFWIFEDAAWIFRLFLHLLWSWIAQSNFLISTMIQVFQGEDFVILLMRVHYWLELSRYTLAPHLYQPFCTKWFCWYKWMLI